MSVPQQCLSCDQLNPSDASFCKSCGSPLNLKLCEKCEAINESSAERCHECNRSFRRVPRPAMALGVAALTGLGGGLAAAYVVAPPKPPAAPTVVKPLPVPVVHAIEQPALSSPRVSTNPPVTHTKRAADAIRTGNDSK